MRQPASASSRSRPLQLLVTVLLMTACFFAGRLSRPHSNSSANSFSPAGPAPSATSPLADSSALPAPVSVAPNASALAWDSAAWRAAVAAPGSTARSAELTRLIETLATQDPARAVALVEAESNLLLRDQLRQATIRGWARTAPADAARWVQQILDPAAREAGLHSLFVGTVAGHPESAPDLARSLAAQDANDRLGYGTHAIDALSDAGFFSLAAGLAASGDESQRAVWLGAAYSRWAEQQPQAAAQAATALIDPAQRDHALHGVIGGWSRADPAAATQFVVQLPADPANASLLGQSLERWTKVDLKGASEWINNHEAGPAMDAGVAAVATRDYLPPDVAVSWAESVVDPKLRSETLTSVLRSWATNDLPAARRYFESTANLSPEDRQEIASLLATLGGSPHG